MRTVDHVGTYTLRLALASANYAELQVWIPVLPSCLPITGLWESCFWWSSHSCVFQVRVNNPNRLPAEFRTGRIGRDNAIARHGIHGLYWLYNVDVPGSQLQVGRNTIYLRQGRGGLFSGIMYDYIRLEGPPQRTIWSEQEQSRWYCIQSRGKHSKEHKGSKLCFETHGSLLPGLKLIWTAIGPFTMTKLCFYLYSSALHNLI